MTSKLVPINLHILLFVIFLSSYDGLALAREVLMFSMLSMLLMQLLGTLAQARRM